MLMVGAGDCFMMSCYRFVCSGCLKICILFFVKYDCNSSGFRLIGDIA